MTILSGTCPTAATVREAAVPVYFCPSRRSPNANPRVSVSGDVHQSNPSGPHVPGALGDYAGNFGCANL